MTTIVIVDFGMGNLRSVAKAFEHVAPKARVLISGKISDVQAADRVVLPGQGAIGGYIKALHETDIEPAVLDAAASKPFLGICLGQQVLYESSGEHGENGESVRTLGLFKGHAKHFTDVSSDPQAMINPQTGQQYSIPHMGWNQVKQTIQHPLWNGIADMARFYFVHSYCVQSENDADVAGVTEYGVEFTSATARDNIFAIQFHPEKSQHDGLKLLENFVNWKV